MSSEKNSYYKMTRFQKYNAQDMFMNKTELVRIQNFYNIFYNNMPFIFFVYISNYFENLKKQIKYYEYGVLNSNFAYSKYKEYYTICNLESVYIDIL